MRRLAWTFIGTMLLPVAAAAQTAVFQFAATPQYEFTERADGRCVLEVSPAPLREEGNAIRSSAVHGTRQRYVLEGTGVCSAARDGTSLQVRFDASTSVTMAPTISKAAKPVQDGQVATGEQPAPADATPAPAAPAAPAEKATPKEIFQKYALDLAVPESPAFTLIGLKTEDVKRPASVRELALALVNGVDESGKPKTGLAIDFAPFQQFDSIVNLTNYTRPDAYVTRALANTTLSLGTAAGTSDTDKSTKIGLGLETVLFDRGDVRADRSLWDCLTPTTLPAPGPLPQTDQERKDAEDRLRALKASDDKAVKKCLESNPTVAASKRWNRSAASAAMGVSWNSDDGSFGGAKTQTKGAWISWAYGFEGVAMLEDRAQFVLSARRLIGERIVDPDDSTKMIDRNSTAAGAKLRMGSSDFNGSLEWTYQWLAPEGKPTDRIRRVALGLEYKLADNIWLVASTGGEGGYKDGKSHSFVLGALRFAPCLQDSCRVLK